MLRDALVSLFTAALIALGAWGLDIVRGIVANGGKAVMSGILASIIGAGVAIAVLMFTGWWLVKDDKKKRKEESDWRKELIGAINKHDDEIVKAIKQIGGQNGKGKNTED